jgi:mannose-1-phosphate guanylyltransferase/phosphomannomutase
MGNVPIMEHLVRLLARQGITDLTVLLYVLPESITNHFADGSRWGVKLQYVTPSADLGTAGAVKYAVGEPHETLLVISGDLLTDFDLRVAVDFHRVKSSEATMVLTRVENPLEYGIVITDDAGRIVRFLEKPSWGEVFSDTINTGMYLLEPSALELVPSERSYDFGKDLFPRLLKEGHACYGSVALGYWRDVGDLTEYRMAHLDLLAGKVRVEIPGERLKGEAAVWLDEGATVDKSAKLSGAVLIGRGSEIGANARIANSVIGPGCRIGERATIEGSVLWQDVEIGAGATLEECIVGVRAVIKAGAFCAEGSVIGDRSTIGKSSVVKANVKVWPYKEVEDGATLAVSLVWGERWSRVLFGRYGITGLANIEISPEFASKLGAAFGASIGKRRVVVTSRDHHKASRMINRALMTGLLSVGVDVQDLGVTPVPVVRYQIPALALAGGSHVRKSPYDPMLIDIKLFDHRGMDCSTNREKAIERLFFREDFYRAPMEETGVLSFPHQWIDRYRAGLLRLVNPEVVKRANFRVVLDYAFGSASSIFPSILGEFGADVIALNAYLDEARISKSSEEFSRSLDQLSNIVRTLNANVGVLMDTGGEKLFLVDEKGELLNGDLSLALMAALVMRTHERGIIAAPVTASMVLETLAAKHGFSVRRSRSSPRALMETATALGVIFVGEEHGGYIFPGFQPAFDGMASVVKLLEMMARTEVSLHQLACELPETHLIRNEIPCPNERKGVVMRRLIEATRGQGMEAVEGVRVKLDENWITALPHPDRACFHIVSESKTLGRAQELAGEYAEMITRFRDGG